MRVAYILTNRRPKSQFLAPHVFSNFNIYVQDKNN